MKIIELAEKVRNNELVPQHIKCSDEDLYFDGYTYYDEEGNNDILDILAMNYSNLNIIFDEVEIIEEDKKTPKKIVDYTFENGTNGYRERLMKDKINEIIDYLEEKE